MDVELQGTCDPRFVAVRDAFAEGFASRGERGGAVAVQVGDELVVDLWGGVADEHTGLPWQRDTIAHAYSVSKPLVAACLLLLVERGLVHLDAPVVRYWPEYAQAGKERTLVRHLLTHEAGLVALREPAPAATLVDWEQLTSLLAAEPPLWEPGTRHGEHALFFGHLVGELVRRVDGRRLGRFLADELAAPWGLDFHVGLRPGERDRAATLVDDGGRWRRSLLDDPRPLLVRALGNPPGILDVDTVNSVAYRTEEVPAVNGHGTARAIARFYAGLAAGGVLDGVRLFRAETVAAMVRPWVEGRDEVLGADAAWGLGLQVDAVDGSFGLGGIGGFSGFGLRRPGVELGYGYVTCSLGGFERTEACEDALEAALAALAAGAGDGAPPAALP